MSPRFLSLVLGCVACFAVIGCGGGVPGSGQVTKGGAPYKLAEGEGMSIALTNDGGGVGGGTVNPDGSFVLKTNHGENIPAGKYKITVTHYKPAAEKGEAKDSKDKGKGGPVTKKYPDEWELNSSNTTLTIDITKLK